MSTVPTSNNIQKHSPATSKPVTPPKPIKLLNGDCSIKKIDHQQLQKPPLLPKPVSVITQNKNNQKKMINNEDDINKTCESSNKIKFKTNNQPNIESKFSKSDTHFSKTIHQFNKTINQLNETKKHEILNQFNKPSNNFSDIVKQFNENDNEFYETINQFSENVKKFSDTMMVNNIKTKFDSKIKNSKNSILNFGTSSPKQQNSNNNNSEEFKEKFKMFSEDTLNNDVKTSIRTSEENEKSIHKTKIEQFSGTSDTEKSKCMSTSKSYSNEIKKDLIETESRKSNNQIKINESITDTIKNTSVISLTNQINNFKDKTSKDQSENETENQEIKSNRSKTKTVEGITNEIKKDQTSSNEMIKLNGVIESSNKSFIVDRKNLMSKSKIKSTCNVKTIKSEANKMENTEIFSNETSKNNLIETFNKTSINVLKSKFSSTHSQRRGNSLPTSISDLSKALEGDIQNQNQSLTEISRNEKCFLNMRKSSLTNTCNMKTVKSETNKMENTEIFSNETSKNNLTEIFNETSINVLKSKFSSQRLNNSQWRSNSLPTSISDLSKALEGDIQNQNQSLTEISRNEKCFSSMRKSSLTNTCNMMTIKTEANETENTEISFNEPLNKTSIQNTRKLTLSPTVDRSLNNIVRRSFLHSLTKGKSLPTSIYDLSNLPTEKCILNLRRSSLASPTYEGNSSHKKNHQIQETINSVCKNSIQHKGDTNETKNIIEYGGDTNKNYKHYFPDEEPIYATIDEGNNLVFEDKQVSDYSTEYKENLRDGQAKYNDDKESFSYSSENTDTSYSDVEDGVSYRAGLNALVKNTFITAGSILKRESCVDRSKRRKNSANNENKKQLDKVKRSSSSLSSKSRPEDLDSISSNSTDGSYNVTRRLRSFFSSFGKGRVYSDTSPYQSIISNDSTCSSDTIYRLEDDKEQEDDQIQMQPESESNDIEISKPEPLSEEELEAKKKRKIFLIVQEIMTAEKVYIGILTLLCKDFKEQCSSTIPPADLFKIINYLPQILTLNKELLKDIEERIQNWEKIEKISDIFVKIGPFFKLYTSYALNFKAQTDYLNECCQKYPLFDKELKIFEKKYCKQLKVQDHMLKPIQRLLQYRLHLEDYLDHLDEDSKDYKDTTEALRIINNVGNHTNESMKQGDYSKSLLQIQLRLGNYEIVKPGRTFIKEGVLFKQSRKDIQERYFILFSDCLLYCGTMTGLKVKYELPINSIKVCLPQTEDHNNEIIIYSRIRSFTVRARSDKERNDWLCALQTVIEENRLNSKSFVNGLVEEYKYSNSELKLGREAPVWIPDEKVTMCQVCMFAFTVTFRRHHCRACGKVICCICSNYKAPLQYNGFRPVRVCEECFEVLRIEFDNSESNMFNLVKAAFSIEDNEDVLKNMEKIRSKFRKIKTNYNMKQYRKIVPKVLSEVTAKDTRSQVKGWLHKKSNRHWKRCWFVLKEQVLYTYKASEDVAALTSDPVLGYDVEALPELDNFQYIFQLKHKGQKPLIFATDSEESHTRWIEALIDASKLH